MNWPWRTVSSLLAEQLVKAETRAVEAEAALVTERRERIAEVRHVFSMFLRHERTYPLPATEAERVEAQEVKQRMTNQPPTLNADQLARRDAVRQWAKTNGFSEEDADKSFMAQLSSQVDE